MPTYLTNCTECYNTELDEIVKKVKPEYVNTSFYYNLDLVKAVFDINIKTRNNNLVINLPIEICRKIIFHANNMDLKKCVNKPICKHMLCREHYQKALDNDGKCDGCCWWDI